MAAKKKTTAAKAKAAKKTTTRKTAPRAAKKVSQKKVPFKLDSGIPAGAMDEKWDKHRFNLKLVNPANKRKYEVIVVGSGLAGASAAATLAELGYNVKCF